MTRVLFFVVAITLLSWPVLALEIDDTFLAKLLDTSASKRTVLINRGSELGLKLGDHAKISLPGHFVARAVVIKVAPTRSVWSVYRFLKKDKLIENTVYRLKIASPVKLTKDESKSLGPWANKIDKREKDIVDYDDAKELKRQKKLARDMAKTQGIAYTPEGQEFASLDDDIAQQIRPRNSKIDWSALDGKRDQDNFNATLDYSKLR